MKIRPTVVPVALICVALAFVLCSRFYETLLLEPSIEADGANNVKLEAQPTENSAKQWTLRRILLIIGAGIGILIQKEMAFLHVFSKQSFETRTYELRRTKKRLARFIQSVVIGFVEQCVQFYRLMGDTEALEEAKNTNLIRAYFQNDCMFIAAISVAFMCIPTLLIAGLMCHLSDVRIDKIIYVLTQEPSLINQPECPYPKQQPSSANGSPYTEWLKDVLVIALTIIFFYSYRLSSAQVRFGLHRLGSVVMGLHPYNNVLYAFSRLQRMWRSLLRA